MSFTEVMLPVCFECGSVSKAAGYSRKAATRTNQGNFYCQGAADNRHPQKKMKFIKFVSTESLPEPPAILTPSEKVEAELERNPNASVREIAKATGASSRTVTRVRQSRRQGAAPPSIKRENARKIA